MTHHGIDWRPCDRDGREWRPSVSLGWAERWAATHPGWSVEWVEVSWEVVA